MSSQIEFLNEPAPWQTAAFSETIKPLPTMGSKQEIRVSDSIKLRMANALQSSLHVQHIIKSFGVELCRVIPDVVVRYRHRAHKLQVDTGPRALNCYSYDLNLVGSFLGEVSFSRHTPLTDEEVATAEVLLCSLVYPLRNALQYESALKIALKDPLTGVSNRASMDAHLKHHVSLAARQETALSLLMIDLDRFKGINDRFGHIVGDVVLTEVAACIVRCTRTSDGVFRYGGEEFVAVLPSTSTAGAELLAERIRSEIAALDIEPMPASEGVTTSIGVAHLVPGDDYLALLERADGALLQAKRDGRNRVLVAPTDVPGVMPVVSR